MEHIRRYMKLGTSNDVILSHVKYQSGSADWLSEHYKAIEEKLSHQLQNQLVEKDGNGPVLLNTICGEIIMGDAKFTYNLRERKYSPAHLVLTGQPGKQKRQKTILERHVDNSIFKYKNYGGLFMKQNVVRAELVVTIERITQSDSHCWKNATVGRENTDTKSAYFKACPNVKPQTPQERRALRHMFREKDHRKRKLSSCDSENATTPTSKARPKEEMPSFQRSRTTEENHTREATKRDSRTILDYMDSPQRKEKQVSSEESDKRSTITTLTQNVKESKRKSYDEGAPPVRPEAEKNMGKGRLKKKEPILPSSGETRQIHHHKSTTGSGRISPVVSDSFPEQLGSTSVRGTLEESQKSAGARKTSQREGRREKPHVKECHTDRLLHKENRQSRHNKCDERTSESQKEVKRCDKAEAPTVKPTKKSSLNKKRHKEKGEKLKKLLTDCGLSDSDSGGEGASGKKKKPTIKHQSQPTKIDRLSPLHALQRGVELTKDNKRESLEDFDFLQRRLQKRTERVRPLKSSTSLCKSLLFASDDDEDDRESTKKGNSVEEYDPSAVIKKESDKSSQGYLPASLKKHVDESDAYVPTVVKKAEKESGAARFVKSHPQPEEYFPTAIPSVKSTLPVNALRGKYEEYVPQAITSTARQQLHEIDYIPTPKKDRPKLYTADIWQDAPYVPERSAAGSKLALADTSVMQLEEEIKSSR